MRAAKVCCCVAAVLAVVVVVGQQGPVTGGDKGYEAELLKAPGGTWTRFVPNDINESERIIGFWDHWDPDDYNNTYETHALLWEKPGSAPEELDGLETGDYTWATAINAKGEICGACGDWFNTWGAVVWDKKGDPQDLHPEDSGVLWSEAYSLNHEGGVAGVIYPAPAYYATPYVWPADDSPGILPYHDSAAFAGRAFSINKKGCVAGEEFVTFWEAHAIVWDAAGVPTNIHADLVKAESAIEFSRAWKVTDDGVVAGLAFDSLPANTSTESWAWTWSKKDGVILLDRGGTDHAGAWQGAGKIFVGFIKAPNFSPETASEAVAAVWRRGTEKGKTVYSLTTIPLLTGYEGMQASSANTSGRVVGGVFDSDGKLHGWFAKPKKK